MAVMESSSALARWDRFQRVSMSIGSWETRAQLRTSASERHAARHCRSASLSWDFQYFPGFHLLRPFRSASPRSARRADVGLSAAHRRSHVAYATSSCPGLPPLLFLRGDAWKYGVCNAPPTPSQVEPRQGTGDALISTSSGASRPARADEDGRCASACARSVVDIGKPDVPGPICQTPRFTTRYGEGWRSIKGNRECFDRCKAMLSSRMHKQALQVMPPAPLASLIPSQVSFTFTHAPVNHAAFGLHPFIQTILLQICLRCRLSCRFWHALPSQHQPRRKTEASQVSQAMPST